MKNWFTGDYHFGHKNVLTLCNRPYENIEDMAEDIIGKHNAVVGMNDTVYDHGDFAFRCPAEVAAAYMNRLNGKRVQLFGNHDKSLRQALNRGLLDGLLNSGRLKVIGPANDSSIQAAYYVTIKGHKLVLSHYAQRSWASSFHGTIHLFGHSHGNLSDFGRSFDIGVDPNNFKPVSFDEVLDKVSKVVEDFTEN
jgi:calcineurin-like phosphoesterase family protein